MTQCSARHAQQGTWSKCGVCVFCSRDFAYDIFPVGRELHAHRVVLRGGRAAARRVAPRKWQDALVEQGVEAALDALRLVREGGGEAHERKEELHLREARRRVVRGCCSHERLFHLGQTIHTGVGAQLVPRRKRQAERGPAEKHKQAADADLRQARERLQTAEVRVRERADLARKASAKLEPLRERLQQAKLDAQGLQVRRQTLLERLQEMNVTLASVRSGLSDDATVDAWVERLSSLERRIQRLGAINLAAIEEFAEQQERAEYIDRQHADLTGALDQLTNAINQIDRETRARFRETFETVNGHFQTRFPMLFGGGEATLELTGDDLLETGIRVMARPPGKRNASIQLLSGGEKAMTAVALLFALFQLTPAPFCMLDEVDAPLDDANVSRYCDMIRHMSDDVQFIIISHNKLTMELADRLHGVTMQEPGVSRLVSVDMEQALEMAG